MHREVVCFGEVLWDIVRGSEKIGGALFNVAAHLADLGLPVSLITSVGEDARGRAALAAMHRRGIDTALVGVTNQAPTGCVDVTLDAHGQPIYKIETPAAWDFIGASPLPRPAGWHNAAPAALICGSLAQRFPRNRSSLEALRLALPTTPVVYDVNLRGDETPLDIVWKTLPGVSVLKVNEEEAGRIATILGTTAADIDALFAGLRREFGLSALVCTRGSRGSVAVTTEDKSEVCGLPVQVASAVGAGDAFTAAFVAGWIRGCPLKVTLEVANLLSAHVASSWDTVPNCPVVLREQLRALLHLD